MLQDRTADRIVFCAVGIVGFPVFIYDHDLFIIRRKRAGGQDHQKYGRGKHPCRPFQDGFSYCCFHLSISLSIIGICSGIVSGFMLICNFSYDIRFVYLLYPVYCFYITYLSVLITIVNGCDSAYILPLDVF